MDLTSMVWPIADTGTWLTGALQEAANELSTVQSSVATTTVENYLRWVSNQVRMFQLKLAPEDLDRLFTTPRYWATLANPTGVLTGMQAITNEILHQKGLLHAAAQTVQDVLGLLDQHPWRENRYVVADTNFWVEHNESFGSIDWRALLVDPVAPDRPVVGAMNILVPILVIDELDGLSHRGDKRSKVSGVNAYLYKTLGGAPWRPAHIDGELRGENEVTMQILFDSPRHVRLPSNDDEIIDRLRAVRDFVGARKEDCYFITYDRGAAFRATAAGHRTRLLNK